MTILQTTLLKKKKGLSRLGESPCIKTIYLPTKWAYLRSPTPNKNVKNMVRLIYIRSRDASTQRRMSHTVCGYYYLYYINYNNIVYYFGKQSMLQQHPALCVAQQYLWKNAV